jgi:hypothetical protein
LINFLEQKPFEIEIKTKEGKATKIDVIPMLPEYVKKIYKNKLKIVNSN